MSTILMFVFGVLAFVLTSFLYWCVYNALRLRGQSRGEAASRVAVAVLILLVAIGVGIWVYRQPVLGWPGVER